jgi:hypothetical protein
MLDDVVDDEVEVPDSELIIVVPVFYLKRDEFV